MMSAQDSSQRRVENNAMKAATSAAAEGADAIAAEKDGRPGETAGRRVILCMEDDAECSSLIKEELEERGFDVVIAENGREGLSIL